MHKFNLARYLNNHRSAAISCGIALSLIIYGAFSAYQVYSDRANVLNIERDNLHALTDAVARHLRKAAQAVEPAAAPGGRLSPDAYQGALEATTINVPGLSTIIASAEGKILARAPAPKTYLGVSIKHGQAYTQHMASGLNQTDHLTVSATDGLPRLITARNFVQGDAPKVIIFATRDLAETLAAWRRRLIMESVQFLIVAGLAGILGRMALRREDRLRQAATSSAEREALYYGLFQGNKAIKLLIDPADGAVIDANPAACAYYGYPAETLKKLNISDINALDEHEIAAETAAAQVENRDHSLLRHRLASGEVRDVEVYSGPVFYQNKQLHYLIIHDVTERRRLEMERVRLVAAIEQSPAAVVITDGAGAIQYVNPAFCEASGYSPEEAIGENPRILKSGHTSDAEYREMWDGLAAGRTYASVFLNKRKDGGLYWEQTLISPLRDSNGQITSYVGVKENITALKQTEEELRAANLRLDQDGRKLTLANAELEQFAYVASHDLRQPLRTIASYLQLISRELPEDASSDIREYLGFATDGARRMDQLIIGLLEYSRIGRVGQNFTPVSLGELLRVSLQTYAFVIADAGAEVNIADNPPTIYGSGDELQRLIDNIIGNALKYQDPERPPVIDVNWKTDNEKVVICIQDNGIGMRAEDHQRAFGMFQRLTAQNRYEGAGIGLAICKKIVEHHLGDIWIDSQLGHGCQFYIRLPLAPDADHASG